MKAYGVVEIISFLTSALDGGEWSVHALAVLSQGKSPSAHCMGCNVGPRGGFDTVEKRKISLAGNRNLAFQPVVILTELPWLSLSFG
jgi:hypothetical protein